MRQPRNDTPQTVSGLKTRYVPKSRIGQGLITVAPWIDVVLLMLFFVLSAYRYVIQPGLIVDLPVGPVMGGSVPNIIAVIQVEGSPESGARSEAVFFGGARFVVPNQAQMASLTTAFRERYKERPDEILVIEADQRVPHGVVVRVMNMALKAGFRRVNVAERPVE